MQSGSQPEPPTMSLPTPEEFEYLLPIAAQWAEEQEKIILRDGVALTPSQIEDARLAGVGHPEKIKLLSVDRIPMPEDPGLRQAAVATHLLSPETGGLTLRYGIFVRADCMNYRPLIVHECAHTAQYERFGGFVPFLRQYLEECLTIGYPEAPLEQEAIEVEKRICGT